MITEKDLIGQLEGFPIQVVKKMLERQVQQGNIEDITVFQREAASDKKQGGFNWRNTVEEHSFWDIIINGHNFELFFKKYPNLSTKVWIRGNEDRSEEVINELVKRGGTNKRRNNETYEYLGYAIDPVTKEIFNFSTSALTGHIITSEYTEITLPEPILEVTMEEVAKKFGVSQIKIKNK